MLSYKIPLVSLLMTVFSVPVAYAKFEFSLSEPVWRFELDTATNYATTAKLTSQESAFARKIQPLMTSGAHQAVLAAFKERKAERDSPALNLLRGQVLTTLKQYDDAITSLNLALKEMPNLELAHKTLGMVYLAKEDYKKARFHLAKANELGVKGAQIYGQLAFSNLQLSHANSAIAGYQQALLLEPENKQWQQGLLYSLINTQSWPQAKALLDSLLEAEPGNKKLWVQRAQIALNQEQMASAIASIETAIILGESEVANITMAAQLHLQSGSPERAVQLVKSHIEKILKSKNKSQITLITDMSAWLSFKRDWELLNDLLTAVAKYEKQLNSTVIARMAVYNAQMSIAKKRIRQAKEQLTKAIEHDPTNGEALLTFASLLTEQNSTTKASLYYQRASVIPKYREQALIGQAQLNINQQKYQQALNLLLKVQEENPSRQGIRTNIQALRRIVLNNT